MKTPTLGELGPKRLSQSCCVMRLIRAPALPSVLPRSPLISHGWQGRGTDEKSQIRITRCATDSNSCRSRFSSGHRQPGCTACRRLPKTIGRRSKRRCFCCQSPDCESRFARGLRRPLMIARRNSSGELAVDLHPHSSGKHRWLTTRSSLVRDSRGSPPGRGWLTSTRRFAASRSIGRSAD